MRWFPIASLGILLAGASGLSVHAEDARARSAPALLAADRVSYDDELGLIVATGHVEISQNDRTLMADTVTYNQRSDTVTASGNVSLLEPSGDVVFANYFELTGGLKDGVAQNFRLLMKDKSRYAAAGARRTGGTLTEMSKGVFSPCELCKDDPERPPVWQIKGAKIVHDEEDHQIYVEDASMELLGVPVAYSPYFSYPDPTVKRQSGFLTPSIGQSTQIGSVLQTPYYWVLDGDKDVTLAPIFTTKGGQVFEGEYRQRWGFGKIDLEGSVVDHTYDQPNGQPVPLNNTLQGHIRGNGVFNLDENWRSGFKVERESSDTYLQIYKTLWRNPTVLTSNAYTEGFFGRSYNSLDAYAFQDTRAQVLIRNSPVVWPIYKYNYVNEAGDYGQRWKVDATALNLTRDSGPDTRRLSQRTRWELPYTSPIGEVYTLTFSFLTDGYATEHNANTGNPTGVAQSAGRALPQGKLDWRYPWVRQDGNVQTVIEPHLAFIAGPQARNSALIPDEDSLDFEFDEQNLYSLSLFPGVDRVAGGERAIYGSSIGAYGAKGGSTSAFFGQMYQFHKDAVFDSTTGLQDNLSDYVGRIQIKPADYLNLTYRFRLSKDDFSPHRSEIAFVGGPPQTVQVGVDYVATTEQLPGQGPVGIEQVAAYTAYHVNPYWTMRPAAVYDLVSRRFRSISTVASYTDECLTFNAIVSRSYTSDRTVAPGTSFLFQFLFKYLGEVQLGGSSGSS